MKYNSICFEPNDRLHKEVDYKLLSHLILHGLDIEVNDLEGELICFHTNL